MNLITDADLRAVLKVGENKKKWIVSSIKHLLGIVEINNIYSNIYSKKSLDFVDSILDRLEIRYSVSDSFKENIPAAGPFIIIANHPLGALDGLLLLKLICEIRPDFKLLGNFLLQRVEPIRDFIMPVNPFENFKSAYPSYNGIKCAYQHLAEGGPLGIFPAGEVSSFHFKNFEITDRAWQISSIRFIQKADVPVIPVYFHCYNSPLFYLLGNIHPLLRASMLGSELLKKRKKTIKIQIRKPILPSTISNFKNPSGLMHFLRVKTYSLNQSSGSKLFFNSITANNYGTSREIIKPVNREIIKSELSKLGEEYLLFSQGNFSVYCIPYSCSPNLMLEIGRLREITFREIGEGTNKSIDIDIFDFYYNHLIVWDNSRQQLAGSYRMGKGREIFSQYGINGFYINSLFKIKSGFYPFLQESLELGRSFVVKDYQRHPLSLFLLWKGIVCYMMKNPEYKYLIGAVSISNDFSRVTKSFMVQFIKRYYFDPSLSAFIEPRNRFKIHKGSFRNNKIILDGIDKDLKILDSYINLFQPSFRMPVLLKKYLQMNAKIIGFNIDPEFNNCLDGLMIVKIDDLPSIMVNSLAPATGHKLCRPKVYGGGIKIARQAII